MREALIALGFAAVGFEALLVPLPQLGWTVAGSVIATIIAALAAGPSHVPDEVWPVRPRAWKVPPAPPPPPPPEPKPLVGAPLPPVAARAHELARVEDHGHHLVVAVYRFADGSERPYVEVHESHAGAGPVRVLPVPEAIHCLQNVTLHELHTIGNREVVP